MKRTILILIALLLTGAATARLSLDFETGAAFSGYNDLCIPNDDNSTMFSFTDDLNSDPVMYGRVNLHYDITPRHQLSFLFAPLKISPEGTMAQDVKFMGKTFTAGQNIEAMYRFDSYRLQYLYRFPNQKGILRAIGASLKLRDAEISLENDDEYATKTNTGFVPLIGLELGYDITDDLGIILKGEGLASKFGRAEDVLLAARYNLGEGRALYGGYRLLEGGSDIGEVYTFALIHYLTLGVSLEF